MESGKVVDAYRFDESVPKTGATVHCFKTLSALQEFARIQGKGFLQVRFWKIKGVVIRDEGGPDGWVIKVKAFKELFHELY
jgi:hypothetical protein